MPEPTSSGVAGAAAAYKAFGGTAAAAVSGATLAAVVVMLMTPPRDKREWTVGLISTVVSSICGGAITIEYFQLHHWAFSTIGLYAMGGVIFACGLPGWALVRWIFNFIVERRDASIDEVAKEVKEML
jgi:sugar (pentulose or hexulose) kinase